VQKSSFPPKESPDKNFTDTSQKGLFIWLDSPAIVATFNHSPTWTGNVLMEFHFALYNKDPRRSCHGSLFLQLTITNGQPTWQPGTGPI
jgi:hypothetical protein